MGWKRFLLLGALGQQLDINQQRAYLEELSAQQSLANTTLESQIAALHWENNELKLFLSAVLRLLVAKGLTTGEELQQLVASIDREGEHGHDPLPLAPPVERDWQEQPPTPND